VQAARLSLAKPFGKLRMWDIVDVGNEEVAVYAMKTTPTDLVYIIPVSRGEKEPFKRFPLLSFDPACSTTFPLMCGDGAAGDEAGARQDSIEVSRVQHGVVHHRSADELYQQVADPPHFGQLRSCLAFGLPQGLYEGSAVGKSLVIAHYHRWPTGTPPPHQGKVRRVPSATRLLHTNTHVGVLSVWCALVPVRCSLKGTYIYPCSVPQSSKS
jgi:hypothetical protein